MRRPEIKSSGLLSIRGFGSCHEEGLQRKNQKILGPQFSSIRTYLTLPTFIIFLPIPNSEKQIFSQMATQKQGARVRDVTFFDTKTHFRPLTSAQPNNFILNHMANPGRTVWQSVRTILYCDQVYHLIYIFLLYLASTLVSKHFHLHSRNDPIVWHFVHSNLEGAFRIEQPFFGVSYLIRRHSPKKME